MAARDYPPAVLGYVRVSSLAQAESGAGLAAQESAIRAECERRGWQLADVIRDEGASGKSLDRPGLRDALDRIARGEAGGLIVAKLDRLSRSVVDFGHLLEWIERADGTLVALDLGIDTSTASGRLVANVMASVAEWERAVIGERTRAGLAAVRADGRPISRAAVADRPELAGRIRGLRDDYRMTYRAIADELNRTGVPTLRGAPAWSPSSVRGAAGYRRPKPRSKAADLPTLGKRRAAA